MSKLPQLNLRIPEQHHDLIRQLAHILRESHGDAFAADLGAWVSGRDPTAPAAGLDDLAARVAELENWRQSLTDPDPLDPAPEVRANLPIDPDLIALADDLNRQGVSFAKIIKSKGWDISVSGLGNAVRRYRKGIK
jgi:hypothetical protein